MSEKNIEYKQQTLSRREKEPEGLRMRLRETGLAEETLDRFHDLIDHVNFSNIDLESASGEIHVDMVASLLSKQENGEVFFQNILTVINKDLGDIREVSITKVKEVLAESIDLDIGANRRVDRIRCGFDGQQAYEFTLSADLEDHLDPEESNSFVEMAVFDSPIAKNNPWLQKYFGYIETKLSGRSYRLIAKEYLPGKNVAQYCNELKPGPETSSDIINIACETAYTMGGLYKRMEGRILSDLKLENIIYNYQNLDSAEPACRVCDHSGFYDQEPERHGVAQILAQLSSLIAMYYAKSTRLEGLDDEERREVAIEILSAYLDSFLSEAGEENVNPFYEQVMRLREEKSEDRPFDLSDDLLDYIITQSRYSKVA